MSPILYETPHDSERNLISHPQTKAHHLSKFYGPQGTLHVEVPYRFYHYGNCPCLPDDFCRRMEGRCRPKQMSTTLPYLFRICLGPVPFSDLVEKIRDSLREILFQSHLMGSWNRHPILVPIINRDSCFCPADGTLIANSHPVIGADGCSTDIFYEWRQEP